jgi:hypothetical protein
MSFDGRAESDLYYSRREGEANVLPMWSYSDFLEKVMNG